MALYGGAIVVDNGSHGGGERIVLVGVFCRWGSGDSPGEKRCFCDFVRVLSLASPPCWP